MYGQRAAAHELCMWKPICICFVNRISRFWMAFVTSTTIFMINKMVCFALISIRTKYGWQKSLESNRQFKFFSVSGCSIVLNWLHIKNSFIPWLLSWTIDLSDICCKVEFLLSKQFDFNKNPDVDRLL